MAEYERRPFDFEAVVWLREPKPAASPPAKPPPPIRAEADATPTARWFRRPTPPPPLLVVAYLSAFLSGLAVLLGVAVEGSLGAAPGAVLFVAAAAWARWLAQARYRPGGTDDFRLEDPDDLDVCEVELRVVVGGLCKGKDRGAAWFEDGCLVYSGLRTSFALGGEDVLPKAGWKVFADAEGGSSLPTCGVPLQAPTPRTYASFWPISRIDGGRSYRRNLRFLGRLAKFRDAPEPSRGPRRLPPLVP